MKILFNICCLLLCFSCLAQHQELRTCNYRIEYAMDVVRDTAELDFFKDWRYILIGDEQQSRFYETNNHFNDSMRLFFTFPPDNASQEEHQQALDEYMEASSKWKKRELLGYRIEKNFSTQITKINAFKLLPPTHLEINTEDFNWEITGAQDSLYGLAVIKARLKYGGRNWIAWYAPDIPISDGPYVFSALPGLIVKIEDEKKWYNFNLSRLTIGNVDCHWGDYYIHHLSQSVSREQYTKIAYDAQNNPKMGGIVNPDPELLLRIKRNAAWKYFMLLEQ